jgi:hypothetical protein
LVLMRSRPTMSPRLAAAAAAAHARTANAIAKATIARIALAKIARARIVIVAALANATDAARFKCETQRPLGHPRGRGFFSQWAQKSFQHSRANLR